MANTVTALTTVVTGEALWASIAPAMPWLGTLIIFAFSFYVFRKITKGAQKGKGRT